jgi:hypothetical protein
MIYVNHAHPYLSRSRTNREITDRVREHRRGATQRTEC